MEYVLLLIQLLDTESAISLDMALSFTFHHLSTSLAIANCPNATPAQHSNQLPVVQPEFAQSLTTRLR